jgi:hypothetical protein
VFWNHALRDAPAGVSADPRYLIPYDNPVPTPYPVAVTGKPLPHGKAVRVDTSSKPTVTTPAKSKRGSSTRDFGRMFKRFDANKDGVVTLEELQGSGKEYPAALTKMFKKLDTNKDSRLTSEEIQK